MERYVIVYRDGRTGGPYSWTRMMFFIGICRRVPWPFKPVQVVDLSELERLLSQREGHGCLR